jgi:hypothetical protein
MIKACHYGLLFIRATATACSIAIFTAFRWKHRFLKALAADRGFDGDLPNKPALRAKRQ